MLFLFKFEKAQLPPSAPHFENVADNRPLPFAYGPPNCKPNY